MVSIIPGNARTSADLFGQQIAQSLQQNVQPAVAQGLQRQRGHSAIDQLQQDLSTANGDMSKILPAIARAYTDNPNLERSGIAQYALQNAKAANIYGNQPPPATSNPSQSTGQTQPQQQPKEVPPLIPNANNVPPGQARPTGYNLTTPAEIDAQGRRDAQATGDPTQYQRTVNEKNALNDIALNYKSGLEKLALDNNISKAELPDFMEVGEQFDTRNPNQWFKNTQAVYAPIKSSLDRMEKAFIPGMGSALIGKNRDEALKRLTPDVQDLKKMGREDQARTYLASQWLSPIEVEEQINPLQKKQEVALARIPKGVFPAKKPEKLEDVKEFKEKLIKQQTHPFVDYETAVKNAPKEMQTMQNQLSDFFLKNVDDDTSLSVLGEKLWRDRDYDWRQIGPAIRQAQEKGLQLNPRQKAEMSNINTQAPIQSLPNIFEDWWRAVQFMRGAK